MCSPHKATLGQPKRSQSAYSASKVQCPLSTSLWAMWVTKPIQTQGRDGNSASCWQAHWQFSMNASGTRVTCEFLAMTELKEWPKVPPFSHQSRSQTSSDPRFPGWGFNLNPSCVFCFQAQGTHARTSPLKNQLSLPLNWGEAAHPPLRSALTVS